MNDDERLQLAEHLERSVWRAVMERDGEALKELFTDDYVEITLSGKRVHKSDVVAKSPQVDEISAYELVQTKAISLSASSFLLSYHVTIAGTCRGEEILPRKRWATSIWRQRGQVWKCCFFGCMSDPELSAMHSRD